MARGGKSMTKEQAEQKIQEKGIKNIKIIDFHGFNKKATFLCTDHNIQWDTWLESILKGCGCCECKSEKLKKSASKKRTQEEFEAKLKEVNPWVVKIGEKKGCNDKIPGECINHHVSYKKPKDWLQKAECIYCSTQRVYNNFENSIADKHSELVKYFKDKKEAEKFSCNSTEKVWCVCPECGTEKEYTIRVLYRTGFHCDVCETRDFSKANKFLKSFIWQLEDNYDIQLPLPYKKDYFEIPIRKQGEKYRYDGGFIFNDQLFLFEFDGIQHREGWGGLIDVETFIENDENKTQLAKEKNAILIRVPCNRNLKEEISSALLKSELTNYFDLSVIDWNKCENFAQTELMKLVCKEFNEDNSLTIKSFTTKYGVNRNTIASYLKEGYKLGLNPKYVKKNDYNRFPNGYKKVSIFLYTKSFEFLEEYKTRKECVRDVNNKYGLKMSEEFVINNYNKVVYNSKYNFFFFDHKLSNEEIEQYKKECTEIN